MNKETQGFYKLSDSERVRLKKSNNDDQEKRIRERKIDKKKERQIKRKKGRNDIKIMRQREKERM